MSVHRCVAGAAHLAADVDDMEGLERRVAMRVVDRTREEQQAVAEARESHRL